MSAITATQLGTSSEDPVGPAGEEAGWLPCMTARFGDVSVRETSVIAFPDGLIGLGGSRYALLSTDPDSPFMWLQSLENPGIALPVCNPHRFFGDFTVELSDDEAAHLSLTGTPEADVLVTITASATLREFTANLKAPILVRDGQAHQVINQARSARVKTPLFTSEDSRLDAAR